MPMRQGTSALTTPANTATNVSTTPTSWSAADQADTYQLIVASNADYSTIVINQSGLTGTSYTPGTALNTNTTYYWKVIAVNGSGTTISDGRQFTTVPPDDNDGADQQLRQRHQMMGMPMTMALMTRYKHA